MRKYLKLLKGIIHSIYCYPTKNNHQNGIYEICLSRGGQLHKKIGIHQAENVKCLTVKGIINITDLFFMQHMDNLEMLDLKQAVYLRKKQNEASRNRLRKNLLGEGRKLRKIWLPNSMGSIPAELFKNCHALEEVVIPHSVKLIGSAAFRNSGIKRISIPSSVKLIGHGAFDHCENLESVKIEDSRSYLKWKGEQFKHCHKLKDIYLGRNSVYEYALNTEAKVERMILSNHIGHINFDVPNIEVLECRMKKPPHIFRQHISPLCKVIVTNNFELFWIDPQWNKMNLIQQEETTVYMECRKNKTAG